MHFWEFLLLYALNSFNGVLNRQQGVFLSTKHEGEGIGLNSIHAIVKNYGGHTQFAPEGQVFQSSVALRLPDVV